MIFSHTLDLLLSRRKTQTRRIKKPHEFLIRQGSMWRVEAKTDKSHRVVYNVGKIYAVQPGRTQKAVAHIKLTSIREEAVSDISEADAIAEGFDSREAFFDAWRRIHGAKADMQQRVWVLEFELLEEKA
jgi:hypothetical protein